MNSDPTTALVFDFGERHIGLALANPETGIVTQLDSVDLRGRSESRAAFEPFVSYWQPRLLVVGLPLNMDGTESAQSVRCREFGHRLGGWFRKPIAYADERLSTREALAERGELSDTHSAAARLIGETWLQTHCRFSAPASPTVHDLQSQVAEVQARVRAACLDAERKPSEVRLIAVSKTRSSEEIRRAAFTGLRDFGENYLQEAMAKRQGLADLNLCWHFIGRIQSNKARAIAGSFDWVHTIDSPSIADRLDRGRRGALPHQPLHVCLQVNIDGEASKSGVAPTELKLLAEHVAAKKHLRLRGLMALPKPREHEAHLLDVYSRIRSLFDATAEVAGRNWDTLSMGMSGDYSLAIAAGATMVRIGTAIFGSRP